MSSTSPEMIQGIRISCKGDIDVLKAKKFISVTVSRSAPMFEEKIVFHGDPITNGKPVLSDPVSPLSELIGIPLQVRKIAPDNAWKNDDVIGRYENQEATFLHP